MRERRIAWNGPAPPPAVRRTLAERGLTLVRGAADAPAIVFTTTARLPRGAPSASLSAGASTLGPGRWMWVCAAPLSEARKTEASKLDINFGSQIRSYVLAPYRMIKDHRTKLAIGDVDRVLEGDLEPLIHAYLVYRKTGRTAGDGKDDLPE